MTWLFLWLSIAWGQSGWTGTQEGVDEEETEEEGEEEAKEEEAVEPEGAAQGPPTDLAVPEAVEPLPGVDPMPEEEVAQDEPGPVPESAPIDISTASEAPTLSAEQLGWLKPKRTSLPPNPYAQTDFTAYTLEWGEAQVGLVGLTMGILPRTQAGLSIPLYFLRIPNVNAKINAIRTKRVDVGVLVNYLGYTLDDFHASNTGAGLRTSVIVTDMWSLHGSVGVNRVRATGLPDMRKVNPLLTTVSGSELDDFSLQVIQDNIDLDILGVSITPGLATDIRLNRRDSIVLEGTAVAWRKIRSDASVDEIPPILGMDQWLATDEEGAVPLASAYAATAAWHLAWRTVDLRVGIGSSSLPGLWLLQSTRLSWRFGGETRRNETQMRRTWRENQDELGGD